MQVGEHILDDAALLFHAISGSRAQGLATPQSDTDIKGVYVLPQKDFFGLKYTEQINNPTNDVVFYELKRFFELLLKNNPNILELLATPANSVLFKHQLFELISPHLFLSKLCNQTFVQFAEAQIKKARGLNKKIVNPVDRERKTIANFCYIAKGQGSVPLGVWLAENNYSQEQCGLAAVPHFKDTYTVFYSNQTGTPLKGIFSGIDANDVLLSSIPKGIEPLALLNFNKGGYSTYCREYKEYWDWVAKRNESRYEGTMQHGKNYDAKNMMHVFRLLNMAEDIATKGEVIVKRPEKEFLLQIKSGKYEYDYLMQAATEKIAAVNSLFISSPLPEKPNETIANNLLVEIRERFYSGAI
jgi:uncharacterized protein